MKVANVQDIKTDNKGRVAIYGNAGFGRHNCFVNMLKVYNGHFVMINKVKIDLLNLELKDNPHLGNETTSFYYKVV